MFSSPAMTAEASLVSKGETGATADPPNSGTKTVLRRTGHGRTLRLPDVLAARMYNIVCCRVCMNPCRGAESASLWRRTGEPPPPKAHGEESMSRSSEGRG